MGKGRKPLLVSICGDAYTATEISVLLGVEKRGVGSRLLRERRIHRNEWEKNERAIDTRVRT